MRSTLSNTKSQMEGKNKKAERSYVKKKTWWDGKNSPAYGHSIDCEDSTVNTIYVYLLQSCVILKACLCLCVIVFLLIQPMVAI